MKARVQRKPFLMCPHCDKGEWGIEHLGAGRTFGPWYCDECGGSFTGTMAADGSVDVELRAERKVTTVDVLVLKPQSAPVYFVVHGMRFEGATSVTERLTGHPHDEQNGKRFFYEEHSCPTNWLKPEMVYHDGDSDPHGLLEFVTYADMNTLPPDETFGPNEHDAALIALIETHAGTSSDR